MRFLPVLLLLSGCGAAPTAGAFASLSARYVGSVPSIDCSDVAASFWVSLINGSDAPMLVNRGYFKVESDSTALFDTIAPFFGEDCHAYLDPGGIVSCDLGFEVPAGTVLEAIRFEDVYHRTGFVRLDPPINAYDPSSSCR